MTSRIFFDELLRCFFWVGQERRLVEVIYFVVGFLGEVLKGS